MDPFLDREAQLLGVVLEEVFDQLIPANHFIVHVFSPFSSGTALRGRPFTDGPGEAGPVRVDTEGRVAKRRP